MPLSPEEKAIRFQQRMAKFSKAIQPTLDRLEEVLCRNCVHFMIRYAFSVYLSLFKKQAAAVGHQPVYCPRDGIDQIPIPLDGLHMCIWNLHFSYEALYRLLRFYTHIHFKVKNINTLSGLVNQFAHNYTLQEFKRAEIYREGT